MAQTAAYSFRYCPLESGQYSIYHDSSHSQQAVLADTCRNVMNRHCCQISIAAAPETSLPSFKPHSSLVDSPTVYNLTMTGPIRNVMASRLELLQQCPIKININLSLPAIDCPNIDVLRTECEKIQEESQTEIAIVPPTFANRSSFVAQNRVSIVITGTPAKADHARIRFLVLLDKLSHLDSDTLHIPLELHNLICGKKRVCLQPIIEETSTNIYFPSPFTDFVDNDSDTKHGSAIYISGDHNNIARVKEMLNKLAVQKAKSMYHKEATLQARKLDWMLVHRRDDLRRIMHDNGSFIEFPALGANSGTVVVYAENRVNAERTLRLLNYLACSIYEACFYFSCCDNAIYGSQGTETGLNSITSVASLVSQLSAISGAEVTYNMETASMEILGTERAVRNVYQHLHEMTFLKIFHQDTVFNVELSNDQREFISGKKNGKINKIIKTSGAKIKFLPFSEYNFIIEVESASFTKALDGLTLLQEELPAEISFYVPESYHKRIIGVGGKNIQRIMKKYGVYVKFSNAEEFASLGGYYDNDDNVVARTPMKNQINLDNLRHAVMELISPKDKDFVTRSIEIPFRHHRILVHNHQDHFVQLTRKTNTRLLWPDHELASDAVTLMGPETQIDTAMHLVRSVIPEEYHFHVPESPALNSVLVFDAFRTLVVDRLRKELDIVLEVGPSSPSSTSSNSSDQPMSVLSPTLSNQQPLLSSPPPSATLADAPPMLAPSVACDTTDAVLCLKMTKANIDSLPAALDILVAFLGAHQVPLYDEPAAKLGVASSTSTTSKRSSASTSSIPDSFSHFSSKVLPTVGPAGK
ncbi:uncharacterized protein BYT42DRAFT_490751 [Radiomyces spectabilis]|uniref:uncharacterized protein n=1 Tax=Radiomyces spectabilis TaxID=64574 RepID=UPI00221FE7AD|nr:uncharacterized protein BYT42DRAFT_490751 [Radiomyces spectabilis]KAI8390924.1 hypothetical protein BYT42DRAFT_490751 [Radiomyces spectabilis]